MKRIFAALMIYFLSYGYGSCLPYDLNAEYRQRRDELQKEFETLNRDLGVLECRLGAMQRSQQRLLEGLFSGACIVGKPRHKK